jgi:hypothetical protein
LGAMDTCCWMQQTRAVGRREGTLLGVVDKGRGGWTLLGVADARHWVQQMQTGAIQHGAAVLRWQAGSRSSRGGSGRGGSSGRAEGVGRKPGSARES